MMRDINQVFTAMGFAVLLFLTLPTCATIPHLTVNYRLPPGTDTLSGKKVVLIAQDARENRDLLTPRAYGSFKDFPGNISLSVTKQNEGPISLGLYEPLFTVKEGIRRRLQNEGAVVEYFGSEDEIQLVVVLNSFSLDLKDRKWIVEMGCEVRLIHDNKFLTSQSVSGRGERIKMIGTEEADIVIREVFTDLINRIDIVGLFRRAKLI